ncbi:MAG: S-adenosylmethionine-dependent methyltransferase [Dehalococcoidia bacterium]|nr:S-adenosylmethionine-dependent methyltransferase [Dehalococcoidia bacterium]
MIGPARPPDRFRSSGPRMPRMSSDFASITLQPIGFVHNGEADAACVDWSRVRSQIVLSEGFVDALLGLADYSHVIVVGWLHELTEVMRQRLQAYPSGDDRYPIQGSLALRGARPNPISVTVCRLLKIDGATLEVEGLDLVDGTPILDVKPYIAAYDAIAKASIPRWARG